MKPLSTISTSSRFCGNCKKIGPVDVLPAGDGYGDSTFSRCRTCGANVTTSGRDARLLGNPTKPTDDDDLTDIMHPVAPQGKFRIWASTYILTFKFHLVKDDVIAYYTKLAKDYGGDKVIVRVAHEMSTARIAYEHSHIFIDFDKQYQSVNPRCFDSYFRLEKCKHRPYMVNGVVDASNYSSQPHPNIGPISKRKHLNRIFAYMAKQDHANDDMLEWVLSDSWVEDIWLAENVQEALKLGTGAKDMSGIIAAYNLKPKPKSTKVWKPMFLWQYHMIEYIKMIVNNCKDLDKKVEYGNDRIIWWIYDKPGHMGKSKFANLVKQEFGNKSIRFKNFGGGKDCATMVQQHMMKGGNCNVIIADLPRALEDRAIYEPLEDIKDEAFTAVKYLGGEVDFDNDVLIVTANFLPKMNAMTPDRWKIWNREKHEDYLK